MIVLRLAPVPGRTETCDSALLLAEALTPTLDLAGFRVVEARLEAKPAQLGLGLDNPPAWTPIAGTDETRETSQEAAAAVAGKTAAHWRRRVLEAIIAKPDTDQGIAKRLRIPENTVRPRRVELRDRDLVEAAHDRHGPVRALTDSGRRAQVWCALPGAERSFVANPCPRCANGAWPCDCPRGAV